MSIYSVNANRRIQKRRLSSDASPPALRRTLTADRGSAPRREPDRRGRLCGRVGNLSMRVELCRGAKILFVDENDRDL
jgi:hypothetical protein